MVFMAMADVMEYSKDVWVTSLKKGNLNPVGSLIFIFSVFPRPIF